MVNRAYAGMEQYTRVKDASISAQSHMAMIVDRFLRLYVIATLTGKENALTRCVRATTFERDTVGARGDVYN